MNGIARETDVMVDSNRRFTSEEVSAIVRRGLEHQGGAGDISYAELEDIALQSGISAQALQQAMAEEDEHREQERAKDKWRKRRRSGFYHHLRAYCLVNVFLFAINMMTTPGGYWWFFWPLLGWGLGLAFHAAATFFPNERKLKRGIRRKGRRKSSYHSHQREHADRQSVRMDASLSY